MWFDTPAIRHLIDLGLTEDVGTGDTATLATVPPTLYGQAAVTAKAPVVICGGPLFALVMQRVDADLEVTLSTDEGQRVESGTEVISIAGRVSSILTAERLALNFMGRLSGIATMARRCADEVSETSTVVVDTRKTLPGFRSLDKYAVRVGGCANHRSALDAGIMIKENHIMAAGSLSAAVQAAKAVGSHLLKIEVEIEGLDQLQEAIEAGADVIMLDNMNNEQLRRAVELTQGRALLEASGNMSIERLASVAATGVDFISMGALTHSVCVGDLSLRLRS
ncbi:MAG TPA: carboxylating nicotinate-nucleotide diphosphorylase [Myxococcales bacterium]|nr:nicotinate-nucleotide diphosphorylase (carboxylating) [Myxococcales bacterium]HAN30136.1 carboxylating nicotinate-nucleotide diphosphorylase [Myxococcales bacterium]